MMKVMKRTQKVKAKDFTGNKCDAPDCQEEGTCRAPKDKTLTEYYHFCPKHAREYNEKWDYYRGMSEEEIEANLREDVVWHRPTWSFASRRPSLKDPFNLQKEMGIDLGVALNEKITDPEILKAMRVLGLKQPLQKEDVKDKYRELAKKYHPDINGGNKVAEDAFKKISAAYMVLIKYFKKG